MKVKVKWGEMDNLSFWPYEEISALVLVSFGHMTNCIYVQFILIFVRQSFVSVE